jgi:hypothetical protein
VDLNIEIVAAIWVIVFALAVMATAVINLRAADPRARGVQLATIVALLAVVTVAFEVSGYRAAAALLALAVAAEAVHLVLKRRRRAA